MLIKKKTLYRQSLESYHTYLLIRSNMYSLIFRLSLFSYAGKKHFPSELKIEICRGPQIIISGKN